MKRIIIYMMLLLPVCAIAQQTIKGVVLDQSTNVPLPGATILNEESLGTSSNKNGEFTINCTETLTISFIGYETTTVDVTDCNSPLSISLAVSNKTLEEVEITSVSNSTRTMIEQPMSIAKLDKVDINRGTGLFLDDAINANVPGVYMTRRAVSSGQQFNIRGYGNGVGFRGASNNFDTQGSKVYLNGIPVTDAEGITMMDDIDMGSIGNVEVIKGPSGTLYGLSIAGVVNLQTVKPTPGQTSIGQSAVVGEYGLMRFTSTFQTATEKASILVNYGHQQAEGFMEHNASEKDFVNFVGDFAVSEKQTVNTYFGFSDSYDERGGELTIAQYEAFDYSGNPRYIKNDAHSAIKSFRVGIENTYRFGDHVSNHTTLFGSAGALNSSSAGGWNDNKPMNYGFRSTLDFKYNLGEKFRLSGIVGGELQDQQAHPMSYSMVVDSSNIDGYNIIGGVRSNQVSHTFTYSYFTEWTLHMAMGFSLLGGVGVSNMSIVLDDRTYTAGSNAKRHFRADYNNLISPHAALNKVFNDNLSAYVSYSKGYKAPVSGNIVVSYTNEVNTALVPEEGDQIEIGTKGQLMNKKLTDQVAAFHTKFSNKMTSVAVPDPNNAGTTLYTYITNGGGQINQGVEALVRYKAYESSTAFLTLIRPWANVTYNDFKYDNFTYESVPRGSSEAVQEVYTGNAVAGVSPLVANVGVEVFTLPGFYGNINFNYRDAMPITSDGANMTEAYSLLNAKLGFRKTLVKRLDMDLYAGVNNITGTQYYYMIFVNQLNDAYIPGPNRVNYFGGVSLKYIFW
ncbi:MAG: TonB-dependent receptor [Cyclobacteriaceae bacterium]